MGTVCLRCHENYPQELDDDFIDGVCLPCRATVEHDEWCKKEEAQLRKYNKNYGTDYQDADCFFIACEGGEVDRGTLKRFPMLRSLYEYAEQIKKEIEAEDEKWLQRRITPTLFDQVNEDDLPF